MGEESLGILPPGCVGLASAVGWCKVKSDEVGGGQALMVWRKEKGSFT